MPDGNLCAPTVFVVDDNSSALKAVACSLRAADFRVITFDSAGQFLERHDRSAPGCLVLDIGMPALNGLQLEELLSGDSMPTILMADPADIRKSIMAMKQGAFDVLIKPVDANDLLLAVRAAISSDRATQTERAEVEDIRRRLAILTPREHEVFQRVISGQLNKESAKQLGIVEKTIKVHRARMMEKMQASSVAALVHLAERAGIRSN